MRSLSRRQGIFTQKKQKQKHFRPNCNYQYLFWKLIIKCNAIQLWDACVWERYTLCTHMFDLVLSNSYMDSSFTLGSKQNEILLRIFYQNQVHKEAQFRHIHTVMWFAGERKFLLFYFAYCDFATSWIQIINRMIEVRTHINTHKKKR